MILVGCKVILCLAALSYFVECSMIGSMLS
jgi:hypothetical protein